MTGVNFRFANIYFMNGKCHLIYNFYFTKHSNGHHEWLRAHYIGANPEKDYGFGDFRLDQIEKITGKLK